MMRKMKIHAFQLEIGDVIESDGRFLLVRKLRGSYVRGRGLLVDVSTDEDDHLLECLSVVNVYRGK